MLSTHNVFYSIIESIIESTITGLTSGRCMRQYTLIMAVVCARCFLSVDRACEQENEHTNVGSQLLKQPLDPVLAELARHTKQQPCPVQVLSVPGKASAQEVKRQYRKLAALVHPDKCRLPRAEEAFKLLGKAVAQVMASADAVR